MKSAVVFRMSGLFFVVVSQKNQKLAEESFANQSQAIDWLEREHFDVQSLKIQG